MAHYERRAGGDQGGEEVSKAFDRIKNGLDDIAARKAGATTATIHFDGQSYQMTRPEHDAFRLGVAAGRHAGLREAAAVAAKVGQCANTSGRGEADERFSEDISEAILAIAKP